MDVDKPSFSVYSARAHEKRGLRYTHFRVSATDLPLGWRMEKKSSKNTVWCDSDCTRYQSSIEVEEALRWRAFSQKLTLLSETETVTGGETASEYEPSPVKKPRSLSV